MSRTVLEQALRHIAQKKGGAVAPAQESPQPTSHAPRVAGQPQGWELAAAAIKEFLRAELPHIVRAELESFRVGLVRMLAAERLPTEAVSRAVLEAMDAVGACGSASIPENPQGATVMPPKPKSAKHETRDYNPVEGADALLAIVQNVGALPPHAAAMHAASAATASPAAQAPAHEPAPAATLPHAPQGVAAGAAASGAPPLPVTPQAVYVRDSASNTREDAPPLLELPASEDVAPVAAHSATAAAPLLSPSELVAAAPPPGPASAPAAPTAAASEARLEETEPRLSVEPVLQPMLPDPFGGVGRDEADDVAIAAIPEDGPELLAAPEDHEPAAEDMPPLEAAMPVDDAESDGPTAAGLPPHLGAAMPASASAPFDALISEACEELKTASRAIQAELKVLPVKLSKLIAEQMQQSSHQKHLEAINVSLSSLNEAVGVLSSQDMTASLKRAHAELWPGMDLPAELADIKKRLATIEAAMVHNNA